MEQTPSHPDLDKLLKDAVSRPMTPRDIWQQRVSFVFGQLMESPSITRKMVVERVEEVYGPCPDK